jgi:hypothetical protein
MSGPGWEYAHLIGRVCITPYPESAGLMYVRDIIMDEDPIADGVFIGKHPAGYEDGSIARYFARELRPTNIVVNGNGRCEVDQ